VAAIDSQVAQLTVTSPIDGVVLSRAVEPGEYAAPGGALLVVGSLSSLTITVYVPEDRYGELRLGQTAQVSVDSFPAETFVATVDHIADQAEFTPRNVQTAEGRRSTVFAIRLSIANADGRLKPGMPADVRFE
jgi:multidrug resistance efflux pump